MRPYYEQDGRKPHTYAKNGRIVLMKLGSPGGVCGTPEHGRNLLGGSAMSNLPSCACGCGESVTPGRKYVSGHNLRNLPRSESHRRKIGEAQRRAWRTKRQRMAVGSTYVSHDGYVLVKVLRGSGRWVPQHVLVMESTLGRPIVPGEIVHHINGIRHDNRPENLHLYTSKSTHNAGHRSFERLLPTLLEQGIVWFNRVSGEYEQC